MTFQARRARPDRLKLGRRRERAEHLDVYHGKRKGELAQSPTLTDSPSATILQLSTIYTVSTLPACNSTALATESAVSDASTPSYLGALTGGSSTFTPVVCNGVGVLLA